tara:strand:- start:112 stop:585 length:474 start_codon:yes stop_codon:yes gene_type:complete
MPIPDNILESLKETDRIIMTDNIDIEFKPKIYTEKCLKYKPKGLWYGMGDSWVNWVRSEMPDWECDNLLKLELDESKIIKLNNEEELLAFNEKYGEELYGAIRCVDWFEVSKKYSGIEIPNYLWSLRMDRRVSWYYGWDVASGCVWGEDTIVSIDKI